MTTEKVRENQLRRAAERQGLALSKSRRRDPRAIDYGEMWLQWLQSPIPERQNDAWVGPFRHLEEVEAWLALPDDERERPEPPSIGRLR
jgi:hypothetical protein